VYYEPSKNDHGLRHNPLKACVVPRPIGWLTTINAQGIVNLAPFSFFNLLSYDPPFVLFSAGAHEQDGGKKDTVRNVEATGEFVYNMATWAQREAMNRTSLIVERGVDELAAAGLEALPSRVVHPPRVKGAPVHFECKLHEIVELPGRTPRAVHHVVIGRVVGVHIDDAALTADGRVDVRRIRPIARLGYKDYTSVESVFEMDKPLPEDRR
jgi:flavin reductase (DIM6/NTAB) family NADH-FMN oxidoreductase RutF